jgi:hypothetical protein
MTNRIPLTLFTNVREITPYGWWNDPLNTNDPWNGYPYQWQVQVKVNSQTHSDPTTATPYTYNGLDITIGDWLVFNNNGLAVEIIAITYQDDFNLTLIVEDVALHNLLNDPGQSGNGIGNASGDDNFDCLIINLNAEGIPIFASIPDYSIPINLIADITNRFQFRNYIQDYIPANQLGNSFSIGDVVYLRNDGTYHASISSDANSSTSIGTVTSLNQPDVGNFTYRPLGRYVKNLPTLPGLPGDRLYISDIDPGKLTSHAPHDAAIPVYIKIDDTSAILSPASGGSITGNIVINQNNITAVNPNGNINLVVNGTGTVNIGNILISPEYISTVTPGVPLILSANEANVTITTPLDMAGNKIINLADPQQSQDAATKGYVDAIASGLNAKDAVNAATTTALDATYTPNVAYGSLTSNVYQQLILDDYYPELNDRILVKDQPDEIENGIYRVVQIGSPSQPWLLSRTTDFNGQAPTGLVKAGDFVFVEYGTKYAGTGWVQTTPNPVVVNLSPIRWTQFSSAGVIQPGFGLTQTGTVFDVNVAALIDTSKGLNAIPSQIGHNVLEIQLDPLAPLDFNQGGLRVKNSIAGTGLNFDIPSGSLNINSEQPTVTQLGTVNVGIWNATVIGYQYGGTGLTTIGSSRQVLSVTVDGTALEYTNHSQIIEVDSPPMLPNPQDGDRWYSNTTGTLFTWITDTNGGHWIEL